MSSGRIIFLAYYFPPLVGVASQRAASLAESLLPLGWEPIVITPRAGHYHRADDEQEVTVRVVRTHSLEVSRAVRHVYADVTGQDRPRTRPAVTPVMTGVRGAALRRIVREAVYVPDAQVGWIPFAARAARQVAREDGASFLLSTSVPYSAHLAAMHVAATTGLKWVAEFRDPWSTAHEVNLPASRLRRRLDRRIERAIVRRADHVITTSAATMTQLLQAHPTLASECISVVTNGFVPIADRRRPGPDEPLVILYAGTVAPGEDAAPVIAALDRVHARRPGCFVLRILGPSEPWVGPGKTASPWLRLDGIVTPVAAREAMVESSALLLIQRNEAYRTVLPGKAFEYIGARRPIIAVVPLGWEIVDLLRRHADVRLVTTDVRDGVEVAVERLIVEHRAGDLAGPRVPAGRTAPLERGEQARKLAEILARVGRRAEVAAR